MKFTRDETHRVFLLNAEGAQACALGEVHSQRHLDEKLAHMRHTYAIINQRPDYTVLVQSTKQGNTTSPLYA